MSNVYLLRTAAIVAFKKARSHAIRWNQAGSGSTTDSFPIDAMTGVIDMSSPLFIEHCDILNQVHRINASVNISMLSASFLPNQKWQELALKVASIALSTGAAILHRLLALWHAESARKCIVFAADIVSTSSSFSFADYDFLEPILMVSRAFR